MRPRNFPAPSAKVFHGLAGSIVNSILPHTEADAMALLSQLLCAFGNAAGRQPSFTAEADRHGTNLFILNVGNTSKGRKGSSWGQIEKLFRLSDSNWVKCNIKSGLASGEGLIWSIRDGDLLKGDMGVNDKRLLCIESEFASVLKSARREANTLSPMLRNAWDSKTLQTLTKTSPVTVSEPHLSVIGHITKFELTELINQSDVSNGLGNRFLFFWVTRSKCLPDGGHIDEADSEMMSQEISSSLEFARRSGLIKRDTVANEFWRERYPVISEGKHGVVGSLLGRAEAQIMRIALIQALINKKSSIGIDEMESAFAIHEYCEQSVGHIFGSSLGSPLADKIFEHLEEAPDGLTRTQIQNLNQRNISKAMYDAAFELLEDAGLVYSVAEQTLGRPVQKWFSKKFLNKTNEINEKSPPYFVNFVDSEVNPHG